MNSKDIIEYCLTLHNTFVDYPFQGDMKSITMKHTENKKWFALIMQVRRELYLNIKTNPEYSDLLRNSYDYIIPAYHMNKELWNTVIVSRKVDAKLIKELVNQSYELTKK